MNESENIEFPQGTLGFIVPELPEKYRSKVITFKNGSKIRIYPSRTSYKNAKYISIPEGFLPEDILEKEVATLKDRQRRIEK